MRIVHISLDEKFIDCAIDQFKQLNNVESVFCAQTGADSFTFIKNPDVKLFHSADEVIDFANQEQFDYAILHSMCFAPRILLRLNKPILWCSWGYDIYSDKRDDLQKLFSISLYKPMTRKAADIGPKNFKEKVSLFLRIFGILSNRQKRYNELIKKISYLSVVLKNEFEAARKLHPHLKYFPFRYMSLDDAMPYVRYQGKERSILLGNSLDPTNNHIDLLKLLEERQIQCKVYIPISYPKEFITYKKRLKEFAANLKYVSPIFLEDFIPKEDYFRIFDECSVAIFGHMRQQAIGNVYHIFYSGKKAFFYKDSLNYKYLKNAGFQIFNVEDDLTQEIFNEPLCEEIQKQNYNLVQKDENYKEYMQKLQAFFNQLQNES